MQLVIATFYICFEIIHSKPIEFLSQSPWPYGSQYKSEGTCRYDLTSIHAAGTWKINVTTSLSATLINWSFQTTGTSGNTHFLSNKYNEGPGTVVVNLQFQRETPEVITGYCDSNIDLPGEDITTTDLNHVTINSITTNWSGNIASSLDETTTEILVTAGNSTIQSTTNPVTTGCTCNLPHGNLTDEELLRKITYLVNELKINRKQTLLARSMKTSADDNRASSKAIGTIGVFLMCCFFGIIIISDSDEIFYSLRLVYISLIKKSPFKLDNKRGAKYNAEL